MKKYIGLIFPLILPYVFVLGMYGTLFFDGVILEKVFGEFPRFLLILAMILVLALLSTGITAIVAIKNRWEAEEVAKINMLVKILQIPAYVLIFVFAIFFSLGMILLTPLAGLIYILFDCAVIFMTGVIGAAAAWRCYRENASDGTVTLILAIGQFIFCIDIVCAVVLYIMAGNKRR